jgi:hypothetical protein
MNSPPACAEVRCWRDCGPALILLIVGAIGIAAGSSYPAGHNGQYALLAPPWYDFEQATALVDEAGGGIVGFGTLPVFLIVHSERPGFVRALYRAGAWLVIDAGRLGSCLGFERDLVPGSQGT